MRRAGPRIALLAGFALFVVVALAVVTCDGGGPARVGPTTSEADAPEHAADADASADDGPVRRRVEASARASPAALPTVPVERLTDPIHPRFLVTDRFYRPVENARIELRPFNVRSPVHVVLTDASGQAETAAERGWKCLVRKPGFAPERASLRNDRLTRVVLQPGYPLGGVIVTAAGALVPDARVTLRSSRLRGETVTTGSDGAFRFDDLPADDSPHLNVQSPAGSARLVLVPPGAVDLQVVLDPPSEPASPALPPAKGTSFVLLAVSRPDGSPVPGAAFDVLPLTASAPGGSGTTDERGRIAVRVEHAPGTWISVRLTEPATEAGDEGAARQFSMRVETRAGVRDAPTTFVVPERAPVRIVVYGADGPLTPDDGVVVRFQFAEREWDDALGAFTAEAPDALRHWLNVSAPGYVRHQGSPTIVRGRVNDLIVRLVRAASLRGRIEGPLDEVWLSVTTPGPEEPFHHQVNGPDEHGVWSVGQVPGGDVDVVVVRHGIPVLHRRVAVLPGDDVDVGVLALPEPRAVRGIVRDLAGQPVSGCRIEGDVLGEAIGIPTAATGADGRFELLFGDVPGGVLRVMRRGFGTEAVRLRRGDDSPLDVTLRPGGSVGLLYRRRGTATSWEVETPDGTTSWQPDSGDESIDIPDGYGGRVLADLPVGPLDIIVHQDREYRERVTIRAGETITVRFD